MTRIMLGGDTQLMWKSETAWKDGGTSAAQWFGYATEDGAHSPDENENYEPIRYIGVGGRNIGTFTQGGTEYTGTIRIDKLQEVTLSKFAFGLLTQTGSPTSSRTVTESGTLPSFAFEDAQEAVAGSHLRRHYSGVKINRYTISCREGEELTQEVEYIAGSKTSDVTAKTSVTAATNIPYEWDDISIVISGGGINGPIDTLKEFSWSLNNNLDAEHFLNSTRNIGEQIPGNRDYEFTATLGATVGSAYDWYKKFFEGGSTMNVNLYCFRTSGTDDFNITMTGCKMIDCDQPIAAGGTVKQTWTLQPVSCSLIARTAATGSWA